MEMLTLLAIIIVLIIILKGFNDPPDYMNKT